MFQLSPLAILPVLALVLATASATQAADPMDIIPSDALGFGVVNRMADCDAKIKKITKEEAGLPNLVILDIDTKGIDEHGAIGFMAMSPENGMQPVILVFVAVKDYSTYLQDLPGLYKYNVSELITELKAFDGVVVGYRNGFAIFAKSADRKSLERVLAYPFSVAGEVKSLEPWLSANDASVVVTKAGVKFFAAQGKAWLKGNGESLDHAGARAAKIKTDFQFDAAVLDAVEKNAALSGFGLTIDKAGNIRGTARVRVDAAGELAAVLANERPAADKLLPGIPGGNFIFAGGVEQESSFRALVKMPIDLMKKSPETYGMSAEQAEKLGKVLLEGGKGIRSISAVMKYGEPGEPIFGNIFISMRVDDADRFFTNYEKQTAAMSEIFKDAKEGAVKSSIAKNIAIDGKPALEVEVTIRSPKIQREPLADKTTQALYGSNNKQTVYLIKVDERTVYMSFGASKENLLRMVAQGNDKKSCLQADKDVAMTVAQLRAGSQAIALISARGWFNMMEKINKGNTPGLAIRQFPACPSVGFALYAAPGELSVEMFLPAVTIDSLAHDITGQLPTKSGHGSR